MVYSHASQKRLRKKLREFSTGSMSLSFGAGALSKVQAKTTGTASTIAGHGLTGMSRVSAMQPTIGTVLGASTVLDILPKYHKKKRKKR